ncbi:TPA: TIGR04197 family type VII secretion effector [Streptococcus suis]|uniref:TIGR04197 family type VII secretion effector n=1 Tax=Streptococcus sp. A11 TaxID=3373124 RepID=UPI003706C81F
MVLLQNDVTTASERATALANGVSSLSSSGTVSKDEQTKLGGNDKAKSVIDASYDVSKAVARAIGQMSQNIRSVSSEFQVMDKQIGGQLQELNQVNRTGFTINGPK